MKYHNEKAPWLRREAEMLAALLRSIPWAVTVLFILAVVGMNFLARYTILSLPWLAVTAGIFVSWLAFLLLDIVVKHFGAPAANLLSLLAITVNLIVTMCCALIGRIWNHPSLDSLVGGQWSVLLASTVAYVLSALTNNYTNVSIGRRFRRNPDGAAAYAARSFGSTLLSQMVDNFLFVFLAFVVFPLIPGALPVRWTVFQCLGASAAGAVLELLTEALFAPIGYRMLQNWKSRDVGREYRLRYCAARN